MSKDSNPSPRPYSATFDFMQKAGVYASIGAAASPGVNFFDMAKTSKQINPNVRLYDVFRMGIQEHGMGFAFRGLRYTGPIEVFKNLYRPFLAKGSGNPEDIIKAAVIDTAAQLVSEKMKTEAYTSGTAPNIVKILQRPGGFTCLTSGCGPLLFRQGVFFTSVDQGSRLNEWMSQYVHPSIAVPASSAVAGFMSTIAGTPFDVAKTKQQAANPDRRFFPIILKDLWQSEGPTAIFRGLAPRVGSNIFSIGVVIAAKTVYDSFAGDNTAPSHSVIEEKTPPTQAKKPDVKAPSVKQPEQGNWFSRFFSGGFSERDQPTQTTQQSSIATPSPIEKRSAVKVPQALPVVPVDKEPIVKVAQKKPATKASQAFPVASADKESAAKTSQALPAIPADKKPPVSTRVMEQEKKKKIPSKVVSVIIDRPDGSSTKVTVEDTSKTREQSPESKVASIVANGPTKPGQSPVDEQLSSSKGGR